MLAGNPLIFQNFIDGPARRFIWCVPMPETSTIAGNFTYNAQKSGGKVRIALGRVSHEIGAAVRALADDGIIPGAKVWVPELSQFRDGGAKADLFTSKPHYQIPPVEIEDQQAFVDDLKGSHVVFVHSISGPKLSARKDHLEHFLRTVRRWTQDDVKFTVVLTKGYGDREDRDQVVKKNGVEYPKFNSQACRDFAEDIKFWGAGKVRLVLVEPHSFYAMQIFEDVLGAENVIFPSAAPLFGKLYRGEDVLFMSPDGGKALGTNLLHEASLVRAGMAQLVKEGAIPTHAALLRYLKSDIPLLDKVRHGDGEVSTQLISGREYVRDRKIVLIDDISGSGVTLEQGALALLNAGAKEVEACITHGEFQTYRPDERHKFAETINALQFILSGQFNDRAAIQKVRVAGTAPRLWGRFAQPSYLPEDDRDRVEIIELGETLIAPWIINACDMEAGRRLTHPDLVSLRAPGSNGNGRSRPIIVPASRQIL